MRPVYLTTFILATLIVAGCASNQPKHDAAMAEQLMSQNRDMENLRAELMEKETSLAYYKQEAEKAKESAVQPAGEPALAASSASPSAALFDDLLPTNAQPGQCFARVYVPPKYETGTERIQSSQASEQIEVIPARYEMVEQRILVEEETTVLRNVPAVYDWVQEKVLVKPEHTVWKKGNGAIEKIDNATGEIMCLVKVPAEYQVIRKRILVKPAATREVVIPAKYRTIKVKQEISKPHTVKKVIPEEFQTVTKRNKISEGYVEWRPVLCETNMTVATMTDIQRALKYAGYNPGPIDGLYGTQTIGAVRAYQKSKGLASGGLTYETLTSLGITDLAGK